MMGQAGFLASHGLREFWQCFRFFGRKTPGGRDFVWMTLASVLLIGVGLGLVVVYEGLLNRFADSLIGNIEGHGSPIWVTNDFSSPGALNRDLYQRFANADGVAQQVGQQGRRQADDLLKQATFHPYLEMGSYNKLVALPNPAIWTERHNGRENDFRGWAVTRDDPLWQWSKGQGGRPAELNRDRPGAPLDIVLNATMFKNHFNLDAYLARMTDVLPIPLHAKLPNAGSSPRDIETLWLQVGAVAENRELHEFQIHWVDSLPALQEMAFLLPMSTVNVLEVREHKPEFIYFPEAEGGIAERVRELVLFEADRHPEPLRKLQEAAACLKVAQPDVGIDAIVTIVPPMPIDRLSACLNVDDYPADDFEKVSVRSDPVQVAALDVWVPCVRLNERDWLSEDRAACAENESENLARIKGGNNFFGANIYVSDRADILDTKDHLVALGDGETQLFYLGPLYQDAVQRFSFLNNTLYWLQFPLLFGWVSFALYLFYISIKSVTDHRKVHYGILMANGVGRWGLKSILAFQCLLSLSIGAILAFLLVDGSVSVLNAFFLDSEAAEIGRYSMGLGQLSLLPHVHDLWWSAGVVFAATTGLCLVCLMCMVHWLFPNQVTPTDLIL